jgi:hypothetical protein
MTAGYVFLMSTFVIIGYFGLTDGRRETHNKVGSSGNNIRLNFLCYDASVQCAHGPAAPATIRVYSNAAEVPLPQNTVAHVVAKAFMDADGNIVMDAYFLVPFPGDPEGDGYDDSVPNMPIPLIFGVGHVLRVGSQLASIKTFDVSVSEYIRDAQRFSTVTCVLFWSLGSLIYLFSGVVLTLIILDGGEHLCRR